MEKKTTSFECQAWPLERITPYARNARKIPQSAIDKVAASIQEYGWRQPIVVDTNGVIVAGHTRLLAAQKLGLATAPVHVAVELTEAQIKAYRLMDNRAHAEASFDSALLAIELGDLKAGEFDLDLTGFNPGEIDVLLAPPAEEGKTDADDAPAAPQSDPTTKPGDKYLLGEHVLLCGDSTRVDDVERLMDGGLADLVFTDPPYNVAYEGYTKDKLTIQNDAMTPEEFTQFLRDVFVSYSIAVKATASMYVCHASSVQREFQSEIEAAGFKIRCQIIWAKNTFAWGHGRYKYQHEPIFYCYRAGESDAWYGDKTQSTLWQEKKPAANRLHPTMKPIELIERALNNSSKPGDIVLDLFGGSGSTLIACAKNGRRARLMELDPKYCDVIVKRWEDFTGKKAVLMEAA